ncbi:Gfo/Idh/MocA family protein [Paenibacillus roseipurpureus]|uniref:Gfo/Idh/MocA family oxidoreductase n=1 Tax=Paenibacillus roseopurpureus TaxID=2918901 RepID=A0AA96LPT5_9BACL|nr:Gfo/Idh/MocA family oxidoreductase [Paenibacillus sp. MBLB1832]WNR46022.1 Gfo/Idh/MocA family oxidoreductase [Paenibacillus sp. MBLB1832]
MGIKIGVLGTGMFSKSFIPLFKVHPAVDKVVLADIDTERLGEVAHKFGISETYSSLDDLCGSDVDAIAIFTQRHLHASHTLQALRAGKHVYCAVPMAHSLEDVNAIVNEVTSSGLIYMSGETSYYYPSTIYCRNRFAKGEFGDFVYGEAQYLHDMSHGFYEAFQHSGGSDWKKVAGFPPMYYPTHSVSMILSVTGAKATHVSCLGYRERHEDGIFREEGNQWSNPFSNETALVRTSDGGMARFNEFRRVGWAGKNCVYMSMFGTQGSYEENGDSQIWTSIQHGDIQNLQEQLHSNDYVNQDVDITIPVSLRRDFESGLSKIHPIGRLPEEFVGMPNGHFGSHQFLADDFVKAISQYKLPPIHVWHAAKFCVPGIVAHESALRNGEMLSVPDFGEPKANWSHLE